MPSILPGRFNWHELLTSDPSAAHGFYESVVGWGTNRVKGPTSTASAIGRGTAS